MFKTGQKSIKTNSVHCVPRSSLLQGSLENDELRHYYMALETHSAKGFNEKNII